MNSTPLSKEKLFAYLIVDNIDVDQEVLTKARKGDGISFSKIGDIYNKNENYIKALNWYRSGAAHNNTYSQFKISEMYQNGRGVFKNYSTAIKWGQEALKNGYCEATYLMGHWGTDGVYLHPGTKTSKEWIDEAANLGNKAAQREIDHSFERSNIQNALKWYKKGFQLEDTASKDDMENTDEQSKYLQLEKETKEQKLEIDSLKTKLNVIEQKLKEVQLKKNTVEDEYSHCADSDEELGFKKLFTI